MITIAIVNIRSNIESKVQGKVEVRVSHYDVLYVQIITPYMPPYNWYIKDITDLLYRGTTTDFICNLCLTAYKKYILSNFLKNY
jgi:hypothetical protein